MGFDQLHVLEGRLSDLKLELSRCENSLVIQKKRKAKLDSLIKNMEIICNSDSDDVNFPLKQIRNAAYDAVKGLPTASNISASTTIDLEAGIHADSKLSVAYELLLAELKRVKETISELESKIANLKAQISSCEKSIRSEKWNIASSIMKDYQRKKSLYEDTLKGFKTDPESTSQAAVKKAAREYGQAQSLYNKYKSWL